MNRIPSESLSEQFPAAVINKKLAFLKNRFKGQCFMQRQEKTRGNLATTKGGDKGNVIEQITQQEKYIVTLIRRMEVKQ